VHAEQVALGVAGKCDVAVLAYGHLLALQLPTRARDAGWRRDVVPRWTDRDALAATLLT
jgi:hypothetical protein